MENEKRVSFKELINGEKPVLVDFFAVWCGPCKAMTPILHQVAEALKDQAIVIKVDVDQNPSLASSLDVRAVPTLMLFHKGEMLWSQAGMVSAKQLTHIVQTMTETPSSVE